MSDAKQMVEGFNHNVKHRDACTTCRPRTPACRIRTSSPTSSWAEHPRLQKTSYADIAGAENLPQVVRELMEEQHKEMLRNLVNGVYDDIGAASEEVAQHYQPGELGGGVAVEADVSAGAPGSGAPAPAPGAGWAPPAPAWPEGSEQGVAEDLISDRTLDEVILSYLAEDLGEKK
jgi:hypothetical protein